MSISLRAPGLYPARLLCPWDSPGKNNRSGLPFPSPGDLHNPPGIRPDSPAWQADSRTSEAPGKPQGPLLPSMKSSHFLPQMGCKGCLPFKANASKTTIPVFVMDTVDTQQTLAALLLTTGRIQKKLTKTQPVSFSNLRLSAQDAVS